MTPEWHARVDSHSLTVANHCTFAYINRQPRYEDDWRSAAMHGLCLAAIAFDPVKHPGVPWEAWLVKHVRWELWRTHHNLRPAGGRGGTAKQSRNENEFRHGNMDDVLNSIPDWRDSADANLEYEDTVRGFARKLCPAEREIFLTDFLTAGRASGRHGTRTRMALYRLRKRAMETLKEEVIEC